MTKTIIMIILVFWVYFQGYTRNVHRKLGSLFSRQAAQSCDMPGDDDGNVDDDDDVDGDDTQRHSHDGKVRSGACVCYLFFSSTTACTDRLL